MEIIHEPGQSVASRLECDGAETRSAIGRVLIPSIGFPDWWFFLHSIASFTFAVLTSYFGIPRRCVRSMEIRLQDHHLPLHQKAAKGIR